MGPSLVPGSLSSALCLFLFLSFSLSSSLSACTLPYLCFAVDLSISPSVS